MSGRDQSVKMSRQELRKLADFREMAEAHIERLGAAIMRRRKALGWSRAKLGRETNAHEKTVERWEKAQTAGALDNIEAIAEAFDIAPDDLLAEAMVRQQRGPAPDVLGALNGDTSTQLTRIEDKLDLLLEAAGLAEGDAVTEAAEEVVLDASPEPRAPSETGRREPSPRERRAVG